MLQRCFNCMRLYSFVYLHYAVLKTRVVVWLLIIKMEKQNVDKLYLTKQKKAKNCNASNHQKEMMVEYLKANKNLLTGKFSNTFTCKDSVKKWRELTDILNSIPGAKKEWKSWRKTWQDMRSRTKLKYSKNNQYRNGTGGGPNIEESLSALDEEIINIIKVVSVEGHSVSESACDFEWNPLQQDECDESLELNQTIIEEPDVVNIVNECTGIPDKGCIGDSKMPRLSKKLKHTISAANNFCEAVGNKIQIKKDYYDKKLELLAKIASAKETSAKSKIEIASCLGKIAVSLENIADCIS